MNDNDVTTRDRAPQARSHSQLSTYNQCPREFQLSRIEHIKRRPGPWFPGGTAVHATIERYLREQAAQDKGES